MLLCPMAFTAQTAKVVDMGSFLMFKTYTAVAVPDKDKYCLYPSYSLPLPKTLIWYSEVPGRTMFVLKKKQIIFVEVINTKQIGDTIYVPTKDAISDIISIDFLCFKHERYYKKAYWLFKKANYNKRKHYILQKNNCKILLFNFIENNVSETIGLIQREMNMNECNSSPLST